MAPGGEAPAPRSYHTMAVVGGRTYIFGGLVTDSENKKTILPAKLAMYDFAMNSWVSKAARGSAPAKRSSHRHDVSRSLGVTNQACTACAKWRSA